MQYNNFININIDNLFHNINYIKSKYNYSYYILDVSNNAFNHGMYIINFLADKIDYLYTNNYNDCALIRKYNKVIPTIYSGIINENNIFDLIINNTIILIRDKKTLENIITLNIKDNLNIILNIDVNNYNGINSKHDILDIIDLLKDNKYINILGLKGKINEDEYDNFKYIISPLKDLELMLFNDEEDKNKIKISNALKLNYSVYGINNVKKSLFKKEEVNLKQIFTLNSKVIRIIKNIKNKKETYTGVIPFGYLNGISEDITKVYINNKLYNIKKINDEYSLIEIDNTVNIEDKVEITSYNNPLEFYYPINTLLYFNILSTNLPIIYKEYILEKTFNY